MESRRVAFETNDGGEYYEDDIEMILQSNEAKDKRTLNNIIFEIVCDDKSEAMQYLLEKGYKIGKIYDTGETFLHLAFYKLSYKILSSILPNILPYITEESVNMVDSKGLTILHIACYLSQTNKLIEKCLKYNANVNAVWLVDSRKTGRDGFTPLHFAAVNFEGTNFLKLLIDHKADVNAKDLRGRTPLHIACRVFENPGEEVFGVHASFVKILLENAADVNAKDNCGNTPLLSLFPDSYDTFSLVEYNVSKVPVKETKLKMKLLLEHGADVTLRNNRNETIIQRIIDNLRYLRGPDRFGKPSYDFDDSAHVEMIQQIFAACPDFDFNLVDTGYDTPLELAMSYLSVDIVRILLDHNADRFGDYLFFKKQGNYDYLNIVPRLEEVVNYIGIIELVAKKFDVTIEPSDQIEIIWYLIHGDTENCNCDYFKIKYDGSMVCNLLKIINFGSSQHFEYIRNKLINKVNNYLHRSQMICSVTENLISRKYANIYVDSTLPSYFTISSLLNRPLSADKLAEVEKEVNLMKSTKLSENVTLYDVMVKHPHNIHQYLSNVNFHSIAQEFSLFKDVIKGHLTKSVVRHYVEKTAFDFFDDLFSSLPSVCCKIIMNYLTNEDILSVIEAVA